MLLSVYSLWVMRRSARLQMRQLEFEHMARIGEMSAVLAHEIRNPLGTIKGFVQLAAERSERPRAGCSTMRYRRRSGWRTWCSDLLAYGRPSTPQWKRCGGAMPRLRPKRTRGN